VISIPLVCIGIAVALLAVIWLLVVAFQESPLWGILLLLVLPACLIFVILHWEVAKRPSLTWLLGVGLTYLAGIVATVFGL
jgi:hypothetical protein